MNRVREWLRTSMWRPFTVAVLIMGLTAGLLLDYASSQREHLCESNNRTLSIVKQLVNVTFDDTPVTPGADPFAVLNALPEYKALSVGDRQQVVNTLLVLNGLAREGTTAGPQQRLTAFAEQLVPQSCSGAVLF